MAAPRRRNVVAMPSFFERANPSLAFIYFPGTAPLADAAFGRLREVGIEIEPRAAGDALWARGLRHPDWGTAELRCFREPPPAEDFTQFAINLTAEEKAEVDGSRSAVMLTVPAKRKNVLHDRKTMLRYAAAVMGEDGLLAVDLSSRLPWSRASLADELLHDADLDVEALYCIHAVFDDSPGTAPNQRTFSWLHTHGLGEVGAFDFDFVRPSQAFEQNCGEPIRALAFFALSGELSESSARVVVGNTLTVRTVPVPEFMRTASPDDRQARELDEDHRDDRAVVCEPAGRRLFGLGSDRPVPLRLAQAARFEDRSVLYFPTMASDLMATRAQQTIHLLPELAAEFAEFEVEPVVKIGYPTDSGESREHLWFTFHGLTADSIDATLQNEPYAVSSLRAGERGQHPRDLLTDWMLMGPTGLITPRSLSAARVMRERAPQLREMN
jgi:uncharacterized protein YegJ (DUF2314 family)